MARLARGIRYTLIGAAILVVLLVVAVVVLTRTDFGVEQAGRFALDQLRSSVHGELRVGEIRSGGLLRGVTLHDIRIDDPDGRPFLRADSARLAYRIRTLLGGSIAFDRLILHSPEVFIEQLPGREKWNYENVFPGDTITPTDTTASRSLVLIEDVTVIDGLAVVRMPWVPEGPVTPEDTARLILEEVPGGLVRTLRFEDIDGRLPRILWETPEEEGKLIQIQELATRAYIWETPAEVRRLEGTLTIRDSLIAFEAPLVRLPSSEVEVVGTVILGDPKRYDVEVQGDDLAFADFQWLYPRLPDDGGGALRFRMQSQEGENMLWLAREARIRTAGSEVSGSFGIVTGDTVYFTNVDLQASPLDLELLRGVLPMDVPLEGLLIGTVEVDGPISALRTRGDVRYFGPGPDGAEGGESVVRWAGTVGARPPYVLRNLAADVRALDLRQVARYAPGLRLRGVARGRVEAHGSVQEGLLLSGTASMERDGLASTLRGGGEIAVGPRSSRFDLRLDAVPVALELLGEQFPAAGRVVGAAEGPVTVGGSLDDLRVDMDLRTPAGGLALDGRFSLVGPSRRYRAEGRVTGFRLDRVIARLPETRLTGRFAFDASGGSVEDLEATVTVDLEEARVADVRVHGGGFTGGVSGGLLRVDSLRLATGLGEASARGDLGLLAGTSGRLEVDLRADSLGVLEPLVFADAADGVAVDEPARLGGVVTAAGVLTGSVHRLAATGTVEVRDLLYEQLALRSGRATVAWSPGSMAADGALDSLAVGPREVSFLGGTVRFADRAGTATVEARGPGVQALKATGGFELTGGDALVRLESLDLAVRGGAWRLQEPLDARVGPAGVRVDEAVLIRAPDFGRVRVAGTLPWRGDAAAGPLRADMVLEVDSLSVGEVLRIAQVDSVLDGVMNGRLRLEGTALAPRLQGRVAAVDFRYHGATLDSAEADLRYADRLVAGRFSGWRGGEPILTGEGSVPLDLALAPRTSRGVIDRPLGVRVRADSVPAGLVSFLAPGFRNLDGNLHGELAVVGTTATPELEGQLRLAQGSALFEPLNVRYREVDVTARMGKGSRVDLEGRLETRRGRADVRGAIDLREPADPAFDVDVTAHRFDAAHRRDVMAVADGRLHLGGSYRRPVVSGRVRLVEGELDIDEIWRQYQIVQLDTSLFQLFDIATVAYRPPAENPFLANVILDGVQVVAERDVWVRSQELNVEVVGTLEVDLDRQADDLRMTGSLEASRGTYDLQFAKAPGVPARRFEIRDGSIDFVGTPGIDPNLGINASYRVRRAQGEPIDVVATVTGTLQSPRVSLSSDSDLPLTESDLASYILFGRTGPELSQTETDIIASGLSSLVRPALTGFASTELQRVFSSLGLSVDYIALRAPEYGFADYGGTAPGGVRGMLDDAQVEVGMDLTRDVFVIGSYRLNTSERAPSAAEGPFDQFGLRVEYRFLPTWIGEFYLEDRFARTPSFGLTEIDDRKVKGLSIFREWGY